MRWLAVLCTVGGLCVPSVMYEAIPYTSPTRDDPSTFGGDSIPGSMHPGPQYQLVRISPYESRAFVRVAYSSRHHGSRAVRQVHARNEGVVQQSKKRQRTLLLSSGRCDNNRCRLGEPRRTLPGASPAVPEQFRNDLG
jgi:hypothetical protein